jgi:hypothetical protein
MRILASFLISSIIFFSLLPALDKYLKYWCHSAEFKAIAGKPMAD